MRTDWRMAHDSNAAAPEVEVVAELIRECARTHILPFHGKLEEHHIAFKNGNPRNLVTDADKAAELFLTEKLQALLPGSFVVGEEAAEEKPEILEYLNDPEKTVWVIDPVDGTNNYARGSETFCVIVALVRNGQTEAGWIYDVCNDSMAVAVRGQGAFIDGVRTKVNPEATLGYTGYKGASLSGITENMDVKSLRCSGLEYFHIAQGKAAFSVYRLMKPWDHLAGTLLVEEAGGYVRKWDDSAYRSADRWGGLITAASVQIGQGVRSAIPRKALEKALEP